MEAMRHTRRNDLCRDAWPFSIRPDLTLALGTWFDCDLEIGEIQFFYHEGDGRS
jgi:hypothetical protein